MFQNPQQFQSFQQQPQQQEQDRMHHNLGLGNKEEDEEAVSHGGGPSFPFLTVNFKLGLNENSGNILKDNVLNQEEEQCLFSGNQHHVSECKPNSLGPIPNCWQTQEDSVIKEPFWKPLNTQIMNRNSNKRSNEGEEELERIENKYFSYPSQQIHGNRHFAELEAIYGDTSIREINQTGSRPAVTFENSPKNASLSLPIDMSNPLNFTANGAPLGPTGFDHGSDASVVEEASLRKKKRKRKMRDHMSSVVEFFERLVKQLIIHQEELHRKFLESIEKMDFERKKREEKWRREKKEKLNNEAIVRVKEQAQASCREAAIISFLEKITGQSIHLPVRKTPLKFQPMYPAMNDLATTKANNNESNNNTKNRWPRAEVEALICVRRSIEAKFQEPGVKGPLWEEISASMASMGYFRSAQKCKEKWENINKYYFKKTKENTKKRCQKSKACSYFDQLNELYSRAIINGSCSSSSTSNLNHFESLIAGDIGDQMRVNSELLEAIIVGNNESRDDPKHSVDSTNVMEMVPLKLNFDGIVDGDDELNQESHGKEMENGGEDMVNESENLEDIEEEIDDDDDSSYGDFDDHGAGKED